MQRSRWLKKMQKYSHCLYCKQVFLRRSWVNNPKYCSPGCYQKARVTKTNIKQPRKCNRCEKQYIPTNWYQKFCSRRCRYPEPKARTCAFCSKEYFSQRTLSKYCCRECNSAGFKKKIGTKRGGTEKSTKGSARVLDKLWAELVRQRAMSKCEYCGKTSPLNSHHLFSRSNKSVRWDLENGMCLCVGHHAFGVFSAHKAPIEFSEWVKEKRGLEWFEKLRAPAMQIKK